MEKSVFTPEYGVLIEVLVETRKAAGITQVELAKKLGTTQSRVSKIERGAARLDVIQLREVCLVLGTSLSRLVHDFESQLQKKQRAGRRRKSSGRRGR
jgi:transcriptional regulator with XRE-family HTH domain